MSEKRHVPRCQILITCTVFGPLWTLKIFQNHTTINKKKHVRLLRRQSPPDTKYCQKTTKTDSSKRPKCQINPSLKVLHCSTRFLESFVCRNCPKHDPKTTSKSTQMAPLGAQGGAWDTHGIPKMSLCRFGAHFALQNDLKMTKQIAKIM